MKKSRVFNTARECIRRRGVGRS